MWPTHRSTATCLVVFCDPGYTFFVSYLPFSIDEDRLHGYFKLLFSEDVFPLSENKHKLQRRR